MRAEGPGVLPAKGNALVSRRRETTRSSILHHRSAQRANNSHASVARMDLVAHHLQEERLARWAGYHRLTRFLFQGCALRWANGRPFGAGTSRHARDARPIHPSGSCVAPNVRRWRTPPRSVPPVAPRSGRQLQEAVVRIAKPRLRRGVANSMLEANRAARENARGQILCNRGSSMAHVPMVQESHHVLAADATGGGEACPFIRSIAAPARRSARGSSRRVGGSCRPRHRMPWFSYTPACAGSRGVP